MKRLNFQQQMRLGSIVLVVLCAASILFKVSSLFKLGIMFYGFLFAVNPVHPTGNPTKQAQMITRGIGIVVFFIGMTAKL